MISQLKDMKSKYGLYSMFIQLLIYQSIAAQ